MLHLHAIKANAESLVELWKMSWGVGVYISAEIVRLRRFGWGFNPWSPVNSNSVRCFLLTNIAALATRSRSALSGGSAKTVGGTQVRWRRRSRGLRPPVSPPPSSSHRASVCRRSGGFAKQSSRGRIGYSANSHRRASATSRVNKSDQIRPAIEVQSGPDSIVHSKQISRAPVFPIDFELYEIDYYYYYYYLANVLQ